MKKISFLWPLTYKKFKYDNMHSLVWSKTKTEKFLKHVMWNFQWNFMIHLQYENMVKCNFSNQLRFFYTALWLVIVISIVTIRSYRSVWEAAGVGRVQVSTCASLFWELQETTVQFIAVIILTILRKRRHEKAGRSSLGIRGSFYQEPWAPGCFACFL